MSIWDDPDMKVADDYIKFNDVGDTVTGRIIASRIHRWDDGTASPQLLLEVDGEEKSLTAGQVRLKAALAEKRPENGDTITVTLTDIEKRSGGKTLKHFDVQVVRAGDALAAPAASQTAPAGDTVTLDQSSLTDEQKAALAALGLGK